MSDITINFPAAADIAQVMNQIAVQTGTVRSFSRDDVRVCAADASAEVQQKFLDTVSLVRKLVDRGTTFEGLNSVFIAAFRQEYAQLLSMGQRPLTIKILRNSALSLLALRAVQYEQRAAVRMT